ncbi:HAMP domain-containing sensor histidine kinase [Marivirga arenosa]|uniref:histidine kinase n=1 Tax=Marivirga arenosa TaxID=3059076 RepID=A0AA51ZWZ7_9BACT|nr:HAMP domain-containing sensor histidine kinase [Marivirga sp. BKB1-2]WNB18333.1 HAMP domain-containing sensor histidine kinase [Marivirga sp. BKB1-2]
MKKLNLIIFFLSSNFLAITPSFAQNNYEQIEQIYHNYRSEIDNEYISEDLKVDEFLNGIPSDSEISEQEIKDVIRLLVYLENSDLNQKAINLLKTLIPKVKKSEIFQAFLFQTLGKIYHHQDELVSALENYLKASHRYESNNEFYPLVTIYRSISRINTEGQNYNQGLNYAELAHQIFQENPPRNRRDSILLRSIIDYKGLNNRRLSNHKKAIDNFNESIKMSRMLKDTVFVSIAKGNKAVSYFDLGMLDEALPLLIEDYTNSMKNEVYGSAFNAGIYLARVYQAQAKIEKMDSIFREIEQIHSEYNFSNPVAMTDYFLIAAALAENKGDYKKALDFYKEFEKVDLKRDSIAIQNDISGMQEKYLLDKEISKLELLQQTNELQASHLKLRTAFLIIIAIALLVVLWYVFRLRFKNRKIDRLNELLEAKVSERTARLLEINKELDTYLYRASHDIRRPIRTLLGLNNIAQLTEDNFQLKKLFHSVNVTAMGMDKMLFKLQMAYELNTTHDISKVDIEELIRECIDDMALEIKEHNSQISIDINPKANSVLANNSLLRIALDNIIENSMTYKNEGTNKIEISTDRGNHFFYIHVKDNGFGIDEKYFNDIFKAYFKISNKSPGSGLGLFLAHKAISFLEGEISVSSKVNEGSQFTIKIPLNPR